MNSEDLARQLAMANQALTEKDCLIKHHEIALDLVTATPDHRDQMISGARTTVARSHTALQLLCMNLPK